MSTIAERLERLEATVGQRPGFGNATTSCWATLDRALRCTVVEGEWRIETDLPRALGGAGSAPSPSVVLRAALGACMAMSYRLRAERAGLGPIDVTVEVTTASELSGMLLASPSTPPGFTSIAYHVDVRTDAPEAQVRRVLDEGDRLSPVLDTITRPMPVARSATIRPIGG